MVRVRVLSNLSKLLCVAVCLRKVVSMFSHLDRTIVLSDHLLHTDSHHPTSHITFLTTLHDNNVDSKLHLSKLLTIVMRDLTARLIASEESHNVQSPFPIRYVILIEI